MELYSSAANRAALPAERPVYHSRPRLIMVVIAAFVAVGFFAFLTMVVGREARWQGEFEMYMALGFAATAVGALCFAVYCLLRLRRLDKPSFTLSRDGILLANGTRLAWSNILSNTFTTEKYRDLITVSRTIQIETSLPSPKYVSISATTLAISADEYLALCDAYRAG